MVINNWIENNELLDFYRLTNGITQSWTYRVKESHEQTLKSRLDYVLATPSLVYAISDIKHVLHEYNLTDHATSYFTIDFAPNSKGPGVFRAHPSLLKNNDYKNLIDNTIMRTLLEDLKEKNSHFYFQNMANLQKKKI